MKRHVLIMLMAVCCWIFLVSGDVFSAHHGGGGGRGGDGGHGGGERQWGGGGRGHVVYPGGGYGVYRHQGGVFFNDAPVENSPCVWNGYEYQCYGNDDDD